MDKIRYICFGRGSQTSQCKVIKYIYEFLVEELIRILYRCESNLFFLFFHVYFKLIEKKNLTDYSAVYLEEGESHFISIKNLLTERFYYATLLQTNFTNGFRVSFRGLYIARNDATFIIGTGNDPSDIQSVIATLHDSVYHGPDDFYTDTNEIWFAVIGGRQEGVIYMNVEVTAIDLLSEYNCINRALLVNSLWLFKITK